MILSPANQPFSIIFLFLIVFKFFRLIFFSKIINKITTFVSLSVKLLNRYVVTDHSIIFHFNLRNPFFKPTNLIHLYTKKY